MYKDKDRQREAVRLAVQRHRAKKGITKVLQEPDVIPVIPKLMEKVESGRPLVAHSPTCRCLMCRPQ